MKRTDLLKIISPLPPAFGGHIMLKTNGDTITATSSSESISVSLSASYAGKPFAVCPNQEKLKAALTGLTGDDLKLTIGDSLTVSAKGTRTIQCISPDMFPTVSAVSGDAISTDGAQLRRAITFVRSAAYNGIDKPHLSGVHLNGCDVVATDGYVMRLMEVANRLPVATLPSVSASLLSRLLPDGHVSVVADERRLHISWPTGSMTTGLSPAGFPGVYRRLLADWSGENVDVVADDFARAVSAVCAFAGGKTKSIYINCGKEVALSCADAVEPLDMVSMSCDPRKILLNGGLLQEMLAAYGKCDVTVTLKDGTVSPLMFKDVEGRMGILLPMKQ